MWWESKIWLLETIIITLYSEVFPTWFSDFSSSGCVFSVVSVIISESHWEGTPHAMAVPWEAQRASNVSQLSPALPELLTQAPTAHSYDATLPWDRCSALSWGCSVISFFLSKAGDVEMKKGRS